MVIVPVRRHYMKMMTLLCFVIPTAIPVYYWNETWLNAFLVPTILRYTIGINVVWTINSISHTFGYRPYDKYVLDSNYFTVLIFSTNSIFDTALWIIFCQSTKPSWEHSRMDDMRRRVPQLPSHVPLGLPGVWVPSMEPAHTHNCIHRHDGKGW